MKYLMITPEAFKQFKEIYIELFGECPDDADLMQIAENLLNLYRILFKK